jgi:hypothetical protein
LGCRIRKQGFGFPRKTLRLVYGAGIDGHFTERESPVNQCSIQPLDYPMQAHTPFIEAHLSRHPISKDRLMLLWQYHVKNGQFLRAAGVLFQLAETTEYVDYSLFMPFSLKIG